jgi:hypothetical protein
MGNTAGEGGSGKSRQRLPHDVFSLMLDGEVGIEIDSLKIEGNASGGTDGSSRSS